MADSINSAHSITSTTRTSGRTSNFQDLWRDIIKGRWAYLFISPFFFGFIIFGIYPLIFSFVLGFTDWRGTGPLNFIGLDNFRILLQDKIFWKSMLNGVILFFLYVPIMTFIALVLAVVLNSERVRGFRYFRLVIYLPFVTNMVAAGFAFNLLFSQQIGLVNMSLRVLQLPGVPWLESEWGARISVSLLIFWAWVGYNMVIMLAGLQTIPQDLTEAAKIDGASPRQAFLRITIPLMRPVILFSVILSTIGSFNLFTELVSLFSSTGGGGPLNSTITPTLAVFNQTFGNLRFGYASAMGYIFFALVFVLVLFQMRSFGQEIED